MTSLYLHFPFCTRKCAYCDFVVRVLKEPEQIETYLSYLVLEIEAMPAFDCHTLYFGGGTPALMSPEQSQRVYEVLKEKLNMVEPYEWTLEANPENIQETAFEGHLKNGVNRISLGVQSFNADILKECGRSHSPDDTIRAVQTLRDIGFQNISLDLIYGLPQQTEKSWAHTLDKTLSLRPEHISLYALEVHQKTAFGHRLKKGNLDLPSEETALAAYEWACEKLSQAGYVHYEISNWALPGYESKHNLSYWLNQPYYALGVGAHGYYDQCRYANPNSLKKYYAMCQAKTWAYKNTPKQDLKETIEETLFMGLRLLDQGLSKSDFKTRFGAELDYFYPHLPDLVKKGWLIDSSTHLFLAADAVMYSNTIFMEFLEPQMECV